MFEHLAAFVSRRWWAVILAWIALAVGVNYVAPQWDDVTHDGDVAYMPDRMTSVRGERRLAAAFPESKSKSQIVLVAERTDGPLTAADVAVLDRLAHHFRGPSGEAHDVVEVWDRTTEVVGEKLISPFDESRGQAGLVMLLLGHEFMDTQNIAILDAINAQLASELARPDTQPGLHLGVTGSAAIGGDMLSSAKESISNTEATTVVLVLLILLLVYRAPILVVIPLVTIVASVAVAIDIVALIAHWQWFDFKIFKTTKIFIIVILFGGGTDYCLFLISRYREELARGLEQAAALTRSLAQVSDALVASALTTIFGLGMMFFADFGKFRNAGPTIAMCLAVALLACLTLAPALLRAVGPIVFWPLGVQRSRKNVPAQGSVGVLSVDDLNLPASESSVPMARLWGTISRAIMARPGLILVASILLLAYPAYEGYSVRITYNLLGELQDDRSSVVGTEMLRRHFAAGDIGPLTLVVHHDEGRFNATEGEALIADLTRDLYELDGIEAVRSLTSPLGDPPRRKHLSDIFRSRGRREIVAKETPRARATYLSQVPELAGQVTRMDLVFRYDPFSNEAAALLETVDAHLTQLRDAPGSPWQGAEFDFVGTTAAKRDLQAVTESDQRLIQVLVVLAVYAVLIVILRRPLVCGYLILSVLFSYFVTIGITELVFQWAYGPTFDGLDWKVPIFLFVILVAVGEDYNIYLVTRVFEEQRKFGARDGLQRAIVHTGGIITSCGVIMAGTFLSMMTGTLRGMLELGFALTFGVLLDTFVVRPVLVPCFLALLTGRRSQPSQPATSLSEDDGQSTAPVLAAGSDGNGEVLRPHAGRPVRASSR